MTSPTEKRTIEFVEENTESTELSVESSDHIITTTSEVRLIAKCDLRLLPILFCVYTVSILDRINIGNAKIQGMPQEIKLAGIVSMCQGFVKNYFQLVVCRFFLGIFEAGVFPGSIYLISMYYKRHELHRKFALFYTSGLIAGAFGGLLAFALVKMDKLGGYSGWRWIFIMEGLATIAFSFIAKILIVDWPEDAKFLTSEEKALLKKRLDEDKGNEVSRMDRLDRNSMKRMAKDWKIYVGHRYTFTIVGIFISSIGYAILLRQGLPKCPGALPNSIRYLAVFFVSIGTSITQPLTLIWLANNMGGHLKRAFGSAMQIGFGNIGGIIASNIFIVQEAPKFKTGFGTCLGLLWKRDAGGRDDRLALPTEELENLGDDHPEFRFSGFAIIVFLRETPEPTLNEEKRKKDECGGAGGGPNGAEEPSNHNPPVSTQTPPGPASLDPDASAITESVNSPCMVAESFVPPDDSRLLHESIKTRFTSASSAIAFPKILGIALGLSDPPRLHSFGWNPGKRPEQRFIPQISICDMVTPDEMKQFADVYFREVHPFFGIVDRALFLSKSNSFWSTPNRGTDFEALMCGVFSLGSYFSPIPSPAEARVVEQGRFLLDLSTAHPPAVLSFKHVAAWTLRAIYLRSTTRPHLSWIASCTAVHIAEAIGLHRQIGEQNMKREMPRTVLPLEEDLRIRNFWAAVSINQFFAAEYSRSKVQLDMIDCKPLVSQAGDFTAQTLKIMQSIPRPRIADRAGTISDFSNALKSLAEMSIDAPFLGLLRADACFCVFRMIQAANLSVSSSQVALILEIIRVALDGVKFLRSMGQLWWNVVGVPFHSVCVLLSIGTSESLAMLPGTLETLKNIAVTCDSHLSKEALRTAFTLVQGAQLKKSRELDDLNRGLSAIGDLSEAVSQASTNGFEWELGYDMGFPDFLDLENFMGFDSAPF
ncbi:hypothetical protein G7Y89_g2683 [Cudoniella acicularis]|uniref:Xylanolytic transcriptional activator regulatory domain-containing protein n=1 Tax=Cudoniella acicularis TaxID=354080 RepID=A0A8H4W949_9HELO|nr:hypothetical protein G7Y89_g2683 [Cudoniella acicularis]